EVHRVVDFVKKQESPRYEMELLEGAEGEDGEGGDEEDLSDEMYDMAVRLVTEHRQASISWLQRRLRVGYNRAARMIERMEREGAVSPQRGRRGREVIARHIEEWPAAALHPPLRRRLPHAPGGRDEPQLLHPGLALRARARRDGDGDWPGARHRHG